MDPRIHKLANELMKSTLVLKSESVSIPCVIIEVTDETTIGEISSRVSARIVVTTDGAPVYAESR